MDHVIRLVEQLLARYELDPERAREPVEEQGIALWGFRSGSAHIFIKVERDEEEDGSVFVQVLAPILRVPEKNTVAFYRRLLELNAELVTAAFAVTDDEVNVTAGRAAAGLEVSELHDMVTDVAGFADHFDDKLAVEFGAEMFGDAADNA